MFFYITRYLDNLHKNGLKQMERSMREAQKQENFRDEKEQIGCWARWKVGLRFLSVPTHLTLLLDERIKTVKDNINPH